MSLRLELVTGDVTKLPEGGGHSLEEVQQRDFRIDYRGDQGFELEFDKAKALVGLSHIQDLFKIVSFHVLTEWQYSKDRQIRSAFGPLNRILSVINSTPSYQLFLAGFQVADKIGFLEQEAFEEMAMLTSFSGLLGTVRWKEGKKGRLFFIPEGYVSEHHVRNELVGNGKLFWITLWSGGSMVEEKLAVPYATPIGFNTPVSADTEDAWRRVTQLVDRN